MNEFVADADEDSTAKRTLLLFEKWQKSNTMFEQDLMYICPKLSFVIALEIKLRNLIVNGAGME